MPLVSAWILITIVAAAALYWAVVGLRLWRLAPLIPKVRSGLDVPEPTGGWPLVSVIVPAHNEERVIRSCAESLLASDYPALEVVVVLDRCTDRTRELLRPFAEADPRLVILENGDCPPDWAGKCNAARVGADRAKGDYLVFTDADVRFRPELLRAAVGVALRDRRGLLSLLPTLTTGAWFEHVVQPVAAITLLRMYPLDKVNREERRRPFANGQFLLFNADLYRGVGGHAAVKDDLLEDIAFARLVDERGGRVGLSIAEELLEVNMYPTLQAMRTGWKRIFIEACRRKVGRLRANAVRVAWVGVVVPLAQALAVGFGIAVGGISGWIAVVGVVVGVLLQAIALVWIYAATRTPISAAAFFPIGSALVAKALWDGATDLAAGRPIRWGGREYVLSPRD